MNILITNDDGIEAKGIVTLAKALTAVGNVTVVAPTCERSGASQSLTIHSPLRFKEVHDYHGIKAYGIDGTPADCVKVAIGNILEQKPDIVISGINRGPNDSTNILYSGTVGGAFEGVVCGITSVAVSLTGYMHDDYSVAADFTAEFLRRLPANDKPVVYNINVPPLCRDKIMGVKFTSMGSWSFFTKYEERIDPFQRPYLWLSGFDSPKNIEPGSDIEAVNSGYISVTPLRVDMTDHQLLEKLRSSGEKPWF